MAEAWKVPERRNSRPGAVRPARNTRNNREPQRRRVSGHTSTGHIGAAGAKQSLGEPCALVEAGHALRRVKNSLSITVADKLFKPHATTPTFLKSELEVAALARLPPGGGASTATGGIRGVAAHTRWKAVEAGGRGGGRVGGRSR